MTTLPLSQPTFPCSNDEALGQQITLLASQINAANHRLLQLIAEFDRRKGWSGGGTVRSCAHWLNWKCGIALVAAREKVRVAKSLQDLPLIDAAFAAGEISYSKVWAMSRAATPKNEEYVLNIARYGTASHVEQVVRKYRKVTGKNDSHAESFSQTVRVIAPNVTPATGVTRWAGEDCDYGMAIEGLLARDACGAG